MRGLAMTTPNEPSALAVRLAAAGMKTSHEAALKYLKSAPGLREIYVDVAIEAQRAIDEAVAVARREALEEATKKGDEFVAWADNIGETESGNARAWAIGVGTFVLQIRALTPSAPRSEE